MASSISNVIPYSMFGVKPFDGQNFTNWYYRIKLVLEQNEVLHVLTEDPPEDALLRKSFLTADIKARSILVGCISDNILVMIKEKKSAKEIVETLSVTYEKTGVKSIVMAQKAWRKMEFKFEKPLQEFLQEFQSTAADLRLAGGKVNNHDFIHQLLGAMPPEFDAVVSALDIYSGSTKTDLTFDYVRSTLLAEEERILKRDGAQPHNAFTSSYRNPGNYQSKSKTSFVCYYCKAQGHIKKNCPKLRNKNRERVVIADHNFDFSLLSSFDPKREMLKGCDLLTDIVFVIDSGASCHLVQNCYEKYLTNLTNVDIDINVAKAGETLKAIQKGNISCVSDSGELVNINDVLVCKNLSFNLLSVKKLEEKGHKIIFEDSSVKVIFGNKSLTGQLLGCLYVVKFKVIPENANVTAINNEVMHRRMGHSSLYQVPMCEICIKGKQTRLPYNPTSEERKASRVLQIVSSDICGKISPPTYDGYNYFVTFIDHYSNFCFTYLLRNKSELFEKFKNFKAMMEAKFGKPIENLRCDRGGEYVSNQFTQFCDSEGIRISYSAPRNPSQNGKAERMNRTLMEKARCLLFDSNFGNEMWGEAIMTATYLINRLPSSSLPKNVTPAERWYGFKPDLNKIKIFGCPAYSLIHKEDRNGKLSECSKKLFMAGYCDNGYRLWNQVKKKIEFARNVIFDERLPNDIKNLDQPTNIEMVQIPLVDKETKTDVLDEGEIDPDEGNCQDLNIEIEQASSDEDFQEPSSDHNTLKVPRVRKQPRYLEDFITSFAFEDLALSASAELDVPNNYSEAIESGWKEAIDEELQSLEDNGTWEVVECPPNASVIDSRWVFTTKIIDGSVKKKARLVARGYQQPTLDNEDVFAPVARLTTLRVLLALAAERSLHIHQLDVRSAFLKSSLPEPVFMKPPDGFKCSVVKVLKLVKALYGLKQSPKA